MAGGTVPLEAASYVPRAADARILAALLAGRYCYVLTSRQMGKSSLSVRTMQALRSNGVRTAFVDLTRIGGRNVSAEQWYAGMLGEIGRALGNRAELLAHYGTSRDLSPMQRFFSAIVVALEDGPEPIVIFLDEIDATRSLPFSTDEFFAGLRECFNRRVHEPALQRLSFCLVGVALPTDLMADPRLTPFNIGERITLSDFTLGEVQVLGEALGPNGVAIVQRIYYWTSGHPFLTQSLCRMACESTDVQSPADVDRLVGANLLQQAARESNVNLADVGNRVLNGYDTTENASKYRADILSMYQQVLAGRVVTDDESNRLAGVLKLSGLVRSERGRLVVRNRIYQEAFGSQWVRENMPEQEVRRQRRAYRKGVLRTLAVAGSLTTVICFLAGLAYLNALRAREALAIAQRERDTAITERKRADEESRLAYANAVRAAQLVLPVDAPSAETLLAGLSQSQHRGLEFDILSRWLDDVILPRIDLQEGESLLAGHGSLRCLGFSRDGKEIRAMMEDGWVQVWSSGNLKPLRSFQIPGLRSFAAYHTRRSLRDDIIVADVNGRLWRVSPEGKLRWSVPSGVSRVIACDVSNNGSMIAVCGRGGSYTLRRVSDGSLIKKLESGLEDVWAHAFSPDGKESVVMGVEESGFVIDIATGAKQSFAARYPDWIEYGFGGAEFRVTGFESTFTSVVKRGSGGRLTVRKRPKLSATIALPDGKAWLSLRQDGIAEIEDAESGKSIRRAGIPKTGSVSYLDVSSDGDTAFMAESGGDLRVWRLKERPASWIRTSAIASSYVTAISLSGDGKSLLTVVSPYEGAWARMSLLDTRTLLPMWSTDLRCRAVYGAKLSPDGRFAVAAGFDTDKTYVVDARKGRLMHVLDGGIQLPVFLNGGTQLLAGRGPVTLYDVATWRALETREAPRLVGPIGTSADGETCAVVELDGSVTLRRARDWAKMGTLSTPRARCYWLAFSKDGKRLAGVGEFGGWVWDLERDRLLYRLASRNYQHVQFVDDDRRVVTFSDGGATASLALWDADSGQLLCELPGAIGGGRNFELSRDGFLYAGFRDGTVRSYRLTPSSSDRPRKS